MAGGGSSRSGRSDAQGQQQPEYDGRGHRLEIELKLCQVAGQSRGDADQQQAPVGILLLGQPAPDYASGAPQQDQESGQAQQAGAHTYVKPEIVGPVHDQVPALVIDQLGREDALEG